ncbi:hypothetical protein [Dyadobacter pollutisoli]|jgi:hypothetical protein|uniref:Uncharacterized protein n=1 Tax=Dyadobacter pollutisoli TaxID=2910158 RepID=A0A9E8SMZ7_9BACT|nr:hypothetical protein [Dyadobacter pollutisoli]WAC10277.1 hypothetical protein ON006_21270 [Dyadobacter pollutisoli]
METLVVELTHKNALRLLRDLEEMNIIRLHDSTESDSKKLSEKYRGVLSKEESHDLSRHIGESRDEWKNI